MMRRTAEDARAHISRSLVAAGTPIAPATLAEQLRLLRAAVTIAFPGGLPEYDAARALAELAAEGEAGGAPSEAGAATASALGCDPMDPATAELWWAGKPFDRGGKVADRTGRNDKVKVIARLQNRPMVEDVNLFT